MAKTKTIHMSNGRTVENKSKEKEEPPTLLHSPINPHFCLRHFHLSTKFGFISTDAFFWFQLFLYLYTLHCILVKAIKEFGFLLRSDLFICMFYKNSFSLKKKVDRLNLFSSSQRV